MKPFNLELALKGAKVVTRDGREVTQLHRLEDTVKHTLVGVVNQKIETFWDTGSWSYYEDGPSGPNDLFLDPKKKEGWVNIYEREAGRYTQGPFDTESQADLKRYSYKPSFRACVRIEWEE